MYFDILMFRFFSFGMKSTMTSIDMKGHVQVLNGTCSTHIGRI